LIPLVDLAAQYADIQTDIDTAIKRVLQNTSFILGREVSSFEESFADFVGDVDAVGVGSGTAALFLALKACGIGPGDEVITTSHTFVATGEMITQVGATPVLVDIDPATFNLRSDLVESAVTSKTRAIVPVHLYGHPAEMDELCEIARRHDLLVIEDAAQAHGAEYKGHRAGAIGDLACFSFYPAKNLGAYGDAGMVTGKDPELINRVRKLRDHGRTSKYTHDEPGWGERIDALQAAILGAKLPHLDDWVKSRNQKAAAYDELLDHDRIIRPVVKDYVRHAFHLYVIRVSDRDGLLDHLAARGVGAGIHYPVPLHRQPVYLSQGYGEVSLPDTESVVDEIISLPLYPEISESQQTEVSEAVIEFVNT
jgi:dTDP-4-amino-4,6-dideoxygalactose transaminase